MTQSPPPIRLIEVNRGNWQACISLPTSDAHRYVASNLYSIAEAQFYPKAHAFCVYAGQRMLGFVMYGLDEDDETMLWIDRLMIAEPYRGQGYGSAVLRLVLQEAAEQGLARVGLSCESENAGAKRVFEHAGFRPTGRKDGTEDVYHYPLSPGA
jgi:diamine N-acetyltransferase